MSMQLLCSSLGSKCHSMCHEAGLLSCRIFCKLLASSCHGTANGNHLLPLVLPGSMPALAFCHHALSVFHSHHLYQQNRSAEHCIRKLRCHCCRYDLLKVFQTGRSHMVMLTRPPPNSPPPALGTPHAHDEGSPSRVNGDGPGMVTVKVGNGDDAERSPEVPPDTGCFKHVHLLTKACTTIHSSSCLAN